jgi:hypothetical protein
MATAKTPSGKEVVVARGARRSAMNASSEDDRGRRQMVGGVNTDDRNGYLGGAKFSLVKFAG